MILKKAMAELNVSKKSITALFGNMQNRLFMIPEYQRPYQWTTEHCDILWEDIKYFSENSTDKEYFLGTLVYAKNGENLDVIDGQQRLTSFFLLLRSLYFKLENMNSNNSDEQDAINGLKNQIAPCIWNTDEFSGKVTDKKKIHIQSLVATSSDNQTLHSILETGIADPEAKDTYSKNYLFFQKKNNEYAMDHPLQWKNLCLNILRKCILLPIECEDLDMALTIFSTLNDRGLPLTDSDIFKAQIYSLETTDRKTFTENWKNLTNITEQGLCTIDDMFRYYSHILRANAGDKSKEIGLRKFYAQDNYIRLKNTSLMDDILDLAYFWREVNTGITHDQEDKKTYTISNQARKYLQCLGFYPNEFWKYAVTTYFHKNKINPDFKLGLEQLLKQLTAFLFAKFIEFPTVNKIKDDIYSACITIAQGQPVQFNFTIHDENDFKTLLSQYNSSKLTRSLLLLDAYLTQNQNELITTILDIEHIFPKKWQDTNYNGWSRVDADEFLEKLGNKVICEKKLNIQAGNGYFGIKKSRYAQSKIQAVLDLSTLLQNDWVKDDIEQREIAIQNRLISFFKEHLSIKN